MSSEKLLLNKTFSHIYVEKKALDLEMTKKILRRFPSAKIVWIDHYKDVFNRSRQSYNVQHNSQKLILAAQDGALLYPGAPVCQSFGNKYFYYTSQIMNCVYDCEYCYLKGMYPSGNMVIFVNPEAVFAEVEKVLKDHPMYICVSYDTDMLGMEGGLGYVQMWADFMKSHENLTIEVRTKSADVSVWEKLDLTGVTDRVIFAFTMSPREAAEQYEHNTPSLAARINSAAAAQKKGYTLRLCFDPMLYIDGWKDSYRNMILEVFSQINPKMLYDVSVGSFRISSDYLKKMRRNDPTSVITRFPYENTKGTCHYPKELMEEMEMFLVSLLSEYMPKEKIFRWDSQ